MESAMVFLTYAMVALVFTVVVILVGLFGYSVFRMIKEFQNED